MRDCRRGKGVSPLASRWGVNSDIGERNLFERRARNYDRCFPHHQQTLSHRWGSTPHRRDFGLRPRLADGLSPRKARPSRGLLKNPLKGSCGALAALTPYLPRRSANKSSLLTRFDIHHSRQTSHGSIAFDPRRHSSLIPSRRVHAPYRGRAGAHQERVEGERPSIQTLFSQSRLTFGGYSG